MTDITDKSLLRCTVKKTASVLTKHIVVVSYAIVALTAIAIAYMGFENIALPAIMWGLVGAAYLAGIIVGIIISIAWYWYVLAAIPMGYFGYSFMWCIARDLTQDDWKSESANNFAVAFFAFAVFAFAVFTSIAASIAASIAFAVFAVAFFSAIEPVDEITIWYYIFRFPGAVYHHYIKK